MGISQLDKGREHTNMKFSAIILSSAVFAEDTGSTAVYPLDRLHHLVKLSHKLLDTSYEFLPSKNEWKKKFEDNAERMRINFRRGQNRCGRPLVLPPKFPDSSEDAPNQDQKE